jgi:hypothetical protein
LTKKKIKVVVEKVMKWKQIVEALNTPEGEERIQEMTSELERLMVGLDEKVKTTTYSKKNSSKKTPGKKTSGKKSTPSTSKLPSEWPAL